MEDSGDFCRDSVGLLKCWLLFLYLCLLRLFFRLVLLVNFCDVAFVLSSIELSCVVGLAMVTERK